jgi:hypothetical protein
MNKRFLPIQPLNILPKIMVGERRFELPTSWSRTKRATRLRYSPDLKSMHDAEGRGIERKHL